MNINDQFLKYFYGVSAMVFLVIGVQNSLAEDQIKGRTITALDLIQLRELGGMAGIGMSISPDGNYTAFEIHQADVATNSYTVDWYVLPLQRSGQAQKVGNGGDATLFKNGYGGVINGDWGTKEPKWSPDSQWIAYLRKDDGAVQVWRSRADGTVSHQLTENAADVEDFFWSSDGSQLYFRTDAARMALEDAEKQQAAKGYKVDDRFIPAYPSQLRMRQPYELLGGNPQIWVLDLKSGQERNATPNDLHKYEALAMPTSLPAPPSARKVAYSRNERRVAWLENRSPDKNPGVDPPLSLVASLVGPDSEEIICQSEECTGWIDGLWWHSEDSEVIFQKREGKQLSHRTLYAWNMVSREVRQIFSTTDWLSGCNVVKGRAICFLETPTKPRRIVFVDLDTGIMTSLYNPNPEFDEIRLSEVERLEWDNAFGVQTWGYLIKPLDYQPGKRYPLIIVQYRPRVCLRGGVGDEYPTHLFAANGFAVLCLNHPENFDLYATAKTAFEVWKQEWTDNIRQRQILSSMETIIDQLDHMGIIDPKRVGLTGLSAGSEAVQYSLINSSAFAATAFSSPAFEPIIYYAFPEELREGMLKSVGFGNTSTDKANNWINMSLSLNADRVNVPTLIQVSDHEYMGAMQSIVTLREAGKPIDMYVFQDEFHIKWHPKHRFNIYQRNIDWFNFWLRDVRDPDPAKVDQYLYWDRLSGGIEISKKVK